MPLLETKGAASAQGFGLTLQQTAANYIEEVFQTWLYTGNGSTQTITNGIDVTGKGGLIWFKERAAQGFDHALVDTARGNLSSTEGYSLASNQAAAQSSVRAVPTSSGFSLSSGSGAGPVNFNGSTYASWTFRKQPKFFDVVTYTGNGVSSREVSHSLGSIPGCIIIKRTNVSTNWIVWHRGDGTTNYNALSLNDTSASTASVASGDLPTSTTFKPSALLGSDYLNGNANGGTYVAYIFAHNAGGFGLTGTDNVISCGSYVGTSANFVDVNLGYEPQWFMVKRASDTSPWFIIDNMRNMSYGNTSNLQANASNAEQTTVPQVIPSATGISLGFSGGGSGYNVNGVTYIYIAIRRGPMKTPTTGTSVYEPVATTGNGTAGRVLTAGFPVDLDFGMVRNSGGLAFSTFVDRLRGAARNLYGGSTQAEGIDTTGVTGFDNMTGVVVGTGSNNSWPNQSPWTYISWMLRRAPGFFDVVCYTGTGGFRAVAHNLGVAPELIITKSRNGAGNWWTAANITPSNWRLLAVDDPGGGTQYDYSTLLSSPPDATNMYFWGGFFNSSGTNYVAYLFASCPGVSKVFSFTGNGSSQTINCGFTGGSRLVLIKRTDSTGNWVIFDSARGIVAGNDPALYLNSTAAEVTGVDAIDTDSTGFIVNQETTFNLNVNNATYIGLAIS